MELTLYKILIQQLSPVPDLMSLRDGGLLPEEWPLVLNKIEVHRKNVQWFQVTDSKTTMICVSSVPDLYRRITQTELGTIIHLLGPKTIYSQEHKRYILQIEDFATLKQYDDQMRRIREEEARRLADMHDALAEYQHYP